jgi:hypothetical protein
MRIVALTLIVLVSAIVPAKALATVTEFDSLSAEQQKASGITVRRMVTSNGASLSVVIAPGAAKFCKEIGDVWLRNEKGELLTVIPAALTKGDDGSLSIHFDLFDGFHGSAELGISCSNELASPAPAGGSLGYFFRIATKP